MVEACIDSIVVDGFSENVWSLRFNRNTKIDVGIASGKVRRKTIRVCECM